MTVLIFANGDMLAHRWAKPLLGEATAIIAADGGARHALALEVQPDYVIGDLDSVAQSYRETLESAGTQFISHPAAKDETDLELALLYAAEHYDEEILVLGGFGGRVDQMFANILLLVHPLLRQARIRFMTEFQQVWLIQEKAEIRGEVGDFVSLIPLGGDVHVHTASGLRWPLQDELLSFGPARGVSNVMVEEVATVLITAGYLLCVHTRQTWKR